VAAVPKKRKKRKKRKKMEGKNVQRMMTSLLLVRTGRRCPVGTAGGAVVGKDAVGPP
jgi:hypothetical protein